MEPPAAAEILRVSGLGDRRAQWEGDARELLGELPQPPRCLLVARGPAAADDLRVPPLLAEAVRADNDGMRERALAATLASLDSVLAEPVLDCVWRDPAGRPCVEARTPLDLEAELGLPSGNIFHRDLTWPFAETDAEVGTWGVETDDPRLLICGAGARRGGGVSGVPGRNAAMAVLEDAQVRVTA